MVHHIDSTIPHYNAQKATKAVREAFPDIYLHDPTPIHKALWNVAVNCSVVTPKVIDNRKLFVFVE